MLKLVDSGRTLFVVAALLATCPLSAQAHTMGKREVRCPLDGTTFTAMVDMSGTQFGMRLDLKPLGAIAAPWRIPVCPKCRFVVFKDDLPKEQVESLRAFVRSPTYTAKAKTESSHYLLALVETHLGKADDLIAFRYLQASWQVEDKPQAYREYLGRSLAHYEKYLASGKAKGEDRLTALFLSGELRRLRGELDKAKEVFTRLVAMPEFAKPPFQDIIPYELKLIAAKDTAPKPIPDPPEDGPTR
jgi:uncharacterized protein (DUF2225 family)